MIMVILLLWNAATDTAVEIDVIGHDIAIAHSIVLVDCKCYCRYH